MYSKKMLAAATLVAIAASSPALAKSTHHRQSQAHPVDSYAAAYPNVRKQRANHSTNDVHDVRGQYIGSDPDATVRDQLARDPSQGD